MEEEAALTKVAQEGEFLVWPCISLMRLTIMVTLRSNVPARYIKVDEKSDSLALHNRLCASFYLDCISFNLYGMFRCRTIDLSWHLDSVFFWPTLKIGVECPEEIW